MDWSIISDAKALQKEFKGLTDYEALRIVVETHRNSILRLAFNVYSPKEMPALEQIASALGFKKEYDSSVTSSINHLAETIENVFEKRD